MILDGSLLIQIAHHGSVPVISILYHHGRPLPFDGKKEVLSYIPAYISAYPSHIAPSW